MSKQKMTAAELRRALTVVSGNTPVVVDTDDVVFNDMDVVDVEYVDGTFVISAAPAEEEVMDDFEDEPVDDHDDEDDCVGCHCADQPCSYTGFEEPTGFAAPATGFAPRSASVERWWDTIIGLFMTQVRR